MTKGRVDETTCRGGSGARVTALALALLAIVLSRNAGAWYFPEHAEMTRLGMQDYLPRIAQEAILDAVADADFEGLCLDGTTEMANVPLRWDPVHQVMPIGSPIARCIPYATLAALAGDHAVDVQGLWSLIVDRVDRKDRHLEPESVAKLVVGASAYEWRRFLANAGEGVARVWTSSPRELGPSATDPSGSLSAAAHPRDYMRTLDAKLLMADHDYASRAEGSTAHFHDATSSVEQVLQRFVGRGDASNALAQMIGHHVYALQLAAIARNLPDGKERRVFRTYALLSHAFALHFMQDAFAAGHMATDPGVIEGVDRLRRHDHFNRTGAAAARAISAVPCGREAPPRDRLEQELPPCWTAFGDGYARWQDRIHAAEASARLQLQLAMALDGRVAERLKTSASCDHWCDPAEPGEKQQSLPTNTCHQFSPQATDPTLLRNCDLWRAAALLDPFPTWTTSADQARQYRFTRRRSELLVIEAEKAIVSLSHRTPSRYLSAAANSTMQHGKISAELLGDPLRPCVEPRGPFERAPDVDLDLPCASDVLQTYASGLRFGTSRQVDRADLKSYRVVAFGSPAVSLWRPVLVAWPALQADVTTLTGTDAFGNGLAWQLQVGLNMSYVYDLTGVTGAGVSAGLAYRTDSILPHRNSRGLIEANVGLAPSVLFPQREFTTFLFTELRAPISTMLLLLDSYVRRNSGSFDMVGSRFGVGLFGGRAYWSLVRQDVVFAGWDVEVAYVLLNRTSYNRDASLGDPMDTELRLRVGSVDLGPVAPAVQGRTFLVGLEVTSGYSGFLK